MNRLPFLLVCFLLTVSCATAQPTPSPTAQATASHTVAPPTALAQATATPPPATHIVTALPTSTTTTAPTATETATILPTNTPLPTDTPTSTPFPFSLPTGRIYFFWHPDTPLSSSTGDLIRNLYLVTPGQNLEDWYMVPVLENISVWPVTALSPDQTKLAFGIVEDMNQDGSISNQGVGRGSDAPNLYIYDLTNGLLQQATNDFPSLFSLSWFPDSQRLTYPDGDTIFSINTSANLSKTQLVSPITGGVAQVAWSPNGDLLAIVEPFGNLYFFYEESREIIELQAIPTEYTSYISWSPDSHWLISTKGYNKGLFAVKADSQEIVELVDFDFFSSPSWSLDSQHLAFTQSTISDLGTFENSTLSLWDSETREITIVSEAVYFSPAIWSPDNSSLIVSFLERGTGGLLLVDSINRTSHKLFQLTGVTKITPLSWSPDGEWLLFLSYQQDESGLYLIHRSGQGIHQLLDTTGTVDPFTVFWLP